MFVRMGSKKPMTPTGLLDMITVMKKKAINFWDRDTAKYRVQSKEDTNIFGEDTIQQYTTCLISSGYLTQGSSLRFVLDTLFSWSGLLDSRSCVWEWRFKTANQTWFYSSSHNHRSWKWVPPRLVSFTIGSFSTSMIMGGRVIVPNMKLIDLAWKVNLSGEWSFPVGGRYQSSNKK